MKVRYYKPKPMFHKYEVLTSDGQVLYKIKRSNILMSRSWNIKDAYDNQISKISLCFAILLPKIKIRFADGRHFLVKRQLSIENCYEIINSDYKAICDMYSHHIELTDRNDLTIAIAEKTNGSWTDEVMIDITQSADVAEIICLVFAINAINALMRKNN